MDIIAKKVRGFYNGINGLIRPLFEILPDKSYRIIEDGEFLNNGCILVADYERLNTDVSNEIFSIEKGFFIQDDNLFPEKKDEANACQKRINYNHRISSYFSPLPPTAFVPIIESDFDLQRRRILSVDNVTASIFFIQDPATSQVFGPFERDNYDLKAAKFWNYEEDFVDDNFKDFIDIYSEFDGAIIYKFSIEEVERLIIQDSQKNIYLTDFATFFSGKTGEMIEYTPLSLLHPWALQKISLKSKQLSDNIKEAWKLDIPINSIIDELKWNSYRDLLRTADQGTEIIEQIIKVLGERGFLSEMAEGPQLEVLRKELDEATETISVKNEEIIKLKDERQDLDIKLKEWSQKDSSSQLVDETSYPVLASFLNDPEKLAEVEKLIQLNSSIESLNEENNRLKVYKGFVEEDIAELEEKQRRANEAVRLIKQNFASDVAVHTAKLADAKMYSDLLNGINIKSIENEDNEVIKQVNLHEVPSDLNTARSYISEMQRRLKILGRELSFNEVANFIITTNQSFITVIAGAPGVGKTSLVEKYASCNGLSEDFGYLEVNCARGWTSSKDLLGFYNPLTGRYQQSRTKLKESLEKSSANPQAPYLVLLDEANLSPIEHYWSDFIKLADNEYERKLKISDREQIAFGQGFHFIATINYDHTTESLSSRLLDRAPIIQIDRAANIYEEKKNSESFDQIYNYFEVQKLFTETPKWKSDEELIKKFLISLKEKIEANNSGVLISPRKEIAIKRYCKVATGLLEGNSYTALDYAVAQHILPLINGRGDQFEAILRNIKNDLSDKGMVKSEKLLSKILEKGKDFKHFKYSYY